MRSSKNGIWTGMRMSNWITKDRIATRKKMLKKGIDVDTSTRWDTSPEMPLMMIRKSVARREMEKIMSGEKK